MNNMDIKNRFIELRKKILEQEFSRMTDRQQEAIFSVHGPLLILAGAGSGKTTVLVNRVANMVKYGNAYHSEFVPDFLEEADIGIMERFLENPEESRRSYVENLIKDRPIPPWSILAITFTNKAAGELRERLRGMLGEQANDLLAATFHSACARILRREIEKLGYSRDFTIYDTDDSISVIKGLLKEMGLNDKNFTPRSILTAISRAKDSLIDVESYAAQAVEFREKKIADFYAGYQKKLKEANAVDFDDIIVLTIRLFQEFPDVLGYYQNKFRYIMVDEYQDTNYAQYILVSTLAERHGNIGVVGDDDQSIYKFRGATIENILNFEDQFKGCKTVRLEQNYRSTGNILSAANEVIGHNKGRKGKSLWTENPVGDKIFNFTADDEGTEGLFIADKINEIIADGGRTYRDFAVLYRVNAQSNQVENALRRTGIPYRIIGGTRFYDRKEIKDIIAYLCVLNNPTDNLRLKRIINVPKRGIGMTTVEQAEAFAGSVGQSIYSLLLSASDYGETKRIAPKVKPFMDMMEQLRAEMETLPLSDLTTRIMEQSGYSGMLQAEGKEAEDRIQNLNELITNMITYQQDNEGATLSGFLEEVALLSDIDNYDEETGAVVLMTMHSAKGLEFPIVFIPGMEEGVFPSGMSMFNPEEIEEERRLAYVGITRAKERLFLTNASRRMLYGMTSYNQPSRFLREIPDELKESLNEEKVPSRAGANQDRFRQIAQNRQSSLLDRKPKGAVAPSFAKGERVRHPVFGEGDVLSALQVGNDCMLEILFDRVGKKKLMANFAKLQKVEAGA